MTTPLPVCRECGIAQFTINPAHGLCWLCFHAPKCACTQCNCPIQLSPGESGVCADCQLGEHEGWDE